MNSVICVFSICTHFSTQYLFLFLFLFIKKNIYVYIFHFFSQHQCFLGMSAVTLIALFIESLDDISVQVWLCSIQH